MTATPTTTHVRRWLQGGMEQKVLLSYMEEAELTLLFVFLLTLHGVVWFSFGKDRRRVLDKNRWYTGNKFSFLGARPNLFSTILFSLPAPDTHQRQRISYNIRETDTLRLKVITSSREKSYVTYLVWFFCLALNSIHIPACS